MSAFLYLVLTSGRNRLAFGLRRVRSARYAAALVVGALYIWAFLLRPVSRGAPTTAFLGQPTEMIVTLLVAITLMGTWVFGSDTTALAFTPAELSLLFPAPLSRRALIGYKLFRAQIAVLLNALIWVFVLRRGGTALPSPLRAIGLWVLFSTLNLHRLGAALVRSSWREHAGAGARRHRVSIAAFVLIGAGLLVSIVNHWAELTQASGAGAFMTVLGRAAATPPASWVLFLFHAVVAPTFAASPGAWARLILPALIVMGAHAWWVLHSDAAFEDAAIEASAERARRLEAMRSRRSIAAGGPPRAATSTLRLASVGHPAIAIVWKNMLCLRRTAQLRLFIGPTVMAVVLGAAVSGDGGDAGAMVATSALVFCAMLLVFGGRLIRNDLRQDMQHLPLLKSLPIAPGDLILAEVASGALPMAAIQMVLLLIAFVAALASTTVPLGADIRLGILFAAPFGVLALNGALLTIQNGTAVLFPAWIRLGPAVSTGVEALGQNLLAMIASLFSLLVALIVPTLAAFATVAALGEPRGVGVALVIIIAAVILAAETYLVMRFLGGAFSRAEPGAG